MKYKLLSLVCLTVMIFGVGNVQAQLRQSVYLNGNLPTGGFASSINSSTLVPLGVYNIGKDAAIGFGAGYRVSYRFDVGVGEVAPFVGADVFWNMIGKSWRTEYMNYDYYTPTYFNIPVLAGVTYIYDELFNDISLFGEFGVGTDLFLITREGSHSSKELRRAYKPTASFAWMIGAGAYFGRHVSAGLYYYGMGTHPVDYTSSTIENSTSAAAEAALLSAANQREKRTVGSLALRIGFHF